MNRKKAVIKETVKVFLDVGGFNPNVKNMVIPSEMFIQGDIYIFSVIYPRDGDVVDSDSVRIIKQMGK